MTILRKFCWIVVISLVLPFSGNAQSSVGKGDVLLNPSVTLGWYQYNYGLNRVSVIPPVGLNFEYQFSDYFGAGLEGIYSFRKYEDYNYTDLSSSYSYQYQSVTFRLSFHYLDFLRSFIDELQDEKLDALDLYATGATGVRWINTTQSWRDGVNDGEHQLKTFDSEGIINFSAGARYYLSDNFGIFAEGGRNSFGWLKVGLTLKF